MSNLRQKALDYQESPRLIARVLTALANKPVPLELLQTYRSSEVGFGRNCIIPKPFDPRMQMHIVPAVAKATVIDMHNTAESDKHARMPAVDYVQIPA